MHDRLLLLLVFVSQPTIAQKPEGGGVVPVPRDGNDQPVASEQALVRWGTMSIVVTDCGHVTFIMNTVEGDKISDKVKAAGVVGLTCIN